MGRLFIVAVTILVAGQQSTIGNLADLTPPTPTCEPTPSPVVRDGNRYRSGLWGKAALAFIQSKLVIGLPNIRVNHLLTKKLLQPQA